MAELPQERTVESPPFTYCGVDMFGPFTIKKRRSELKRYVALFTCFSSRAIHLETTKAMETDSFINALHRFIGIVVGRYVLSGLTMEQISSVQKTN